MTKILRCKKCQIEITPKGAEKYDGLCYKCAVEEFNKRIREEALALGFDYNGKAY